MKQKKRSRKHSKSLQKKSVPPLSSNAPLKDERTLDERVAARIKYLRHPVKGSPAITYPHRTLREILITMLDSPDPKQPDKTNGEMIMEVAQAKAKAGNFNFFKELSDRANGKPADAATHQVAEDIAKFKVRKSLEVVRTEIKAGKNLDKVIDEILTDVAPPEDAQEIEQIDMSDKKELIKKAVDFYRRIVRNESNSLRERIHAQERMDVLLGLDNNANQESDQMRAARVRMFIHEALSISEGGPAPVLAPGLDPSKAQPPDNKGGKL